MDLPLLLNIRCGNFDGRQSTLGLSFSQNTHDDDDDDDDAADDDDDKFVDGRHFFFSFFLFFLVDIVPEASAFPRTLAASHLYRPVWVYSACILILFDIYRTFGMCHSNLSYGMGVWVSRSGSLDLLAGSIGHLVEPLNCRHHTLGHVNLQHLK